MTGSSSNSIKKGLTKGDHSIYKIETRKSTADCKSQDEKCGTKILRMGLILGDENIRFWQSQRTVGPLHHS